MKTDTALWQAINAYDMDDADAAVPFSCRLARDNGWSPDFTRRAIAEWQADGGEPATGYLTADQVRLIRVETGG